MLSSESYVVVAAVGSAASAATVAEVLAVLTVVLSGSAVAVAV